MEVGEDLLMKGPKLLWQVATDTNKRVRLLSHRFKFFHIKTISKLGDTGMCNPYNALKSRPYYYYPRTTEVIFTEMNVCFAKTPFPKAAQLNGTREGTLLTM